MNRNDSQSQSCVRELVLIRSDVEFAYDNTKLARHRAKISHPAIINPTQRHLCPFQHHHTIPTLPNIPQKPQTCPE
jgi:hypothetical protein